MDNDLNTLATALYVATDDYLNTYPDLLGLPANRGQLVKLHSLQ